MWNSISSKLVHETLTDITNQVAAARLNAASYAASSLWLHAISIPSLRTQLDSKLFCITIAQRVGKPVCKPHTCKCERHVDALSLHILSCQVSPGRFPLHSALNNVVMHTLQHAGFPFILEPVGLDRVDGKRLDGVTIFSYVNGQSLVWDATCVDTFAPSNIIASAIDPESAAEVAEGAK